MKKRYAEIGIGGRARMYYEALVTKFNDINERLNKSKND